MAPPPTYDLQGVRVFACPPDGKRLRSDRDAVDLIAGAQGADLILIPLERLDPDFFQLKTRVAGEMIQKFVTYRRRLAIVGDVSRYMDESVAFRDFVYESNRGRHVWFVANMEELAKRIHENPELSPQSPAAT